jgi:hypothetical protein
LNINKNFHKKGIYILDVNPQFLNKMEEKMKKFLFIILIFIFASSASAAVYKWVDEQGVTNFSDDYSKIPPDYRQRVEEVNIAKMGPSTTSQTYPENMKEGRQSEKATTQPPPISQPLVREGDFAIKLVEALKIGQGKSEAEAESMLASAGIAPKNGWIADYPVTPDVIGELENAISEAADSARLPMGRNDAVKAFRTAAMELGLPILPETSEGYAEDSPSTTSQYTEPSVVNNYYYTEGPPIVTYYPPPPDYFYLYAWIPSPFWYSGFFFPGFYILNDFHTVIIINKRSCVITNHIKDPKTGRIFTLNPARRHAGRMFEGKEALSKRGFNSSEAKNSAQSIFERSRERAALGNVKTPMKEGSFNNRNSVYTRSNRSLEKQLDNRESRPSSFNSRNRDYGRPPTVGPRMSRPSGNSGSHSLNERVFSRPDSMTRQKGMEFQRPSSGETRSFNPPPRGSVRSFSSPSEILGRHGSSSSMGSRGSSEFPRAGGRGSGFGYGNPRF